MSDDDGGRGRVWLYEGGRWTLIDDPLLWKADDHDVEAKYIEAGYSESSTTPPADWFLALGLHGDQARPAVQIRLYARQDPPQCLLDVEGPEGSSRTVYAARLPDGLDLMARWAPITQAGVLTALAGDLTKRSVDHRGRLDTPHGLVESVSRRAWRAVSYQPPGGP